MSKKAKYISAILGVIFIAVLVGVLWHSVYSSKSTVTQVINSNSQSSSVTTTSPVNPGWQTYTNQDWGFSFEYPRGYSVSVNQGFSYMPPSIFINGSSTQNIIQIYPGETSDALTSAYPFASPMVASADYFQSQNDPTQGTDYLGSVTTTDSHTGFQITYAAEPTRKVTFFQTEDGAWIDAETQLSSSTNTSLYDSIIPTFQFMPVQVIPNPNLNTSAWATYHNTALGFSFKYPVLGEQQQVVDASTTPDQGEDISLQYMPQGETQFLDEFDFYVISTSTNQESLYDWFESNIDANGILLADKSFVLEQFPGGGQAYVLNGPLPYAYLNGEGGPVEDAYIMGPQRNYVLSFGQSQVNNLGSYYVDENAVPFILLSTLQFDN